MKRPLPGKLRDRFDNRGGKGGINNRPIPAKVKKINQKT